MDIDEKQHRLVQNEVRNAPTKFITCDVDLNNYNIKKLFKNQVWIKRLDRPDGNYFKRESGLILPTNSNREPVVIIAEVLAIGPDVKVAQVGDLVVIPPMQGISAHKIVDNFQTFYITEDGIIAVVEHKDGKDQATTEILERAI